MEHNPCFLGVAAMNSDHYPLLRLWHVGILCQEEQSLCLHWS